MARAEPRAALDRDDVITAALDLVDAGGAQALTMRALATALGTYPNTVYWHVGDREAVIAQVVDRVLQDISLPAGPEEDWRDWLAKLAAEYRRVLHAHPAIAPLAGSHLLVSPPALGVVERILAVLVGAGFDGGRLVIAYNAYVGSVVGWVSLELAAVDPGGAVEAALTALDPVAYPTIRGHYDELADEAFVLRWHGGAERPMDRSFEAAVRVCLDGLAVLRTAATGRT